MKTFEQLSPREAYAAYMLGSIMVDVRESAHASIATIPRVSEQGKLGASLKRTVRGMTVS